jgi:3-phenylpropionate/trans-cinnamate dioxygenase ferredoxin component
MSETSRSESPEEAGFVAVARLDEIAPGETLRVEVGATLICLVNVGGHVYAVSDDCPHIGGALSDGELTGCTLTCPVHLAQFDVRDGRVLRGPARDDVPTYAVRVEGDQIFVAPKDDAAL